MGRQHAARADLVQSGSRKGGIPLWKIVDDTRAGDPSQRAQDRDGKAPHAKAQSLP